ncbi:uncharacterized protein BT62DRAFT_227969 [Guyanagaster necrorhizus]|uniref:Uncharacterized protein n=1 Tax=Guyanagaster necrorhizus TaxID=856835 RepID=A0A9P7VRU4_9AGAR|nr:uncharacterized protein BT62DRAFT_227969 [Guyanagaster necrorhizus MCA 3950]KAG7444794.1 hypothetical protein BT62DRAFT_227969 [Guyanagaster necrorhizus MCA 3950]
MGLAYCALMIRYFSSSDNNIGKGMTVFGLYMYVIFHFIVNSTIWVYSTVVLPVHLRNKIMALASAFQYTYSVSITGAAPSVGSFYLDVGFAGFHKHRSKLVFSWCIYLITRARPSSLDLSTDTNLPQPSIRPKTRLWKKSPRQSLYSDDAVDRHDCVMQESD